MEWVIGLIAAFCALASVLPYLPVPHGMVRAFDFPRLQVAILSGLTLLICLVVLPWDYVTAGLSLLFVICLALQLSKIIRFSPLWRKVVPQFGDNGDNVAKIKMLVSNVKMGNDNFEKLIHLIAQKDPDIALLIEVNDDWIDALDQTIQNYRYHVSCPKETSYGMLLMSKFPLLEKQVNYLLKSEVPSFDLLLRHDNGETFRLIALHPEPPVPSEDTFGRDGELSLVAKDIRDYENPIIVAGDLNDVAWSRTTRRFMRVSRMLDPREGRGMFNTFDARYFFIRWPLDHIFHSNHFEISQIKRLPAVGSDHFPMFYELALCRFNEPESDIDQADGQDLAEADDVIEKAKKDDDDAIGTNWED